MNNSKLLHFDLNAEKALIAWMNIKNEFVEVPEEYIYNSELLRIYQNWKKQYYDTGNFQYNLIEDDLIVPLSECMEIATTARPNPIINNLRIAYMIRSSCKLIANIDADLSSKKDIVNILDFASSKITDLLVDHYTDKEYKHNESLSEFLVEIDNNMKGRNKFKGIGSHLPDLDWILSGWQRGQVYLISGLEKLGKSRLVRNLFSTWLSEGYGCVMFLLEESPSDVHECIIGCRTKIDTFNFNTNKLTKDQFGKISYATNIYKEQPIYITTKSAVTPQYVKSVIQKQKIEFAKAGKELVFVAIDYVQRMSNDGDTKHEETEKTASQLADIARDENICLIEISQLVSSAEKQKNIPLHTQIRFGKVFKEAANTILTLDDPTRNKDEKEVEPDDFKTIHAHIIQRKGISNVTVDLCAELRYSLFTNFRKG